MLIMYRCTKETSQLHKKLNLELKVNEVGVCNVFRTPSIKTERK